MNPSVATTRRSVLVGAGAVFGVAVTAACSSGTTDDPIPVTNAPAPAAGASDSASAGGSAANPLVKLSDLPVAGSPVSAKTPDGKNIVIAQPEAGQVVAFSAICTHQGCTVVPAEKNLNCPCHGSAFNGYTGAVLKGPASKPLAAYAVTIDGENVVPGA